MKKFLLIILAVVLVLGLVACDAETHIPDVNENEQSSSPETKNEVELKEPDKYTDVTQNPIATMTMENGDVVKIELYPNIAPQTVENFISLASSGFYDGLIFHRVIPGFMAQGGDPNGNGTGDAGYNIFGEFEANGFNNTLSHDVGVISMARAKENNSASSQFFIVTDENAKQSLDDQYAAFGKVLEGMDAVYTIVNSEVIRRDYSDEFYEEWIAAGQKIEEGTELFEKFLKETSEIDRPVNPPKIKTITVDTFGYTYDEPTHY